MKGRDLVLAATVTVYSLVLKMAEAQKGRDFPFLSSSAIGRILSGFPYPFKFFLRRSIESVSPRNLASGRLAATPA